MSSSCKLVFLTGGTGNMGSELIKSFPQWPDAIELRVLVRPEESELPKRIPWAVKLVERLMPGAITKRTETLARGPHGSLRWFADNDEARINAHFKSREDWENIPRNWEQFEFIQPSIEPQLLDHGYDESKDREHWTTDFYGHPIRSSKVATGVRAAVISQTVTSSRPK